MSKIVPVGGVSRETPKQNPPILADGSTHLFPIMSSENGKLNDSVVPANSPSGRIVAIGSMTHAGVVAFRLMSEIKSAY